ncbi:hypothetical protein [Bradyrhizobium diazoefficiens]
MPEHVAAAIEAAKVAGKLNRRIAKRTTAKQSARKAKKKKRGRPKKAESPPLPPAVLTIRQFCQIYDMSPAFYHKLRSAGKGPREMRETVPEDETRVNRGKRKSGYVRISLQAASDWAQSCEQQASAEEEKRRAGAEGNTHPRRAKGELQHDKACT